MLSLVHAEARQGCLLSRPSPHTTVVRASSTATTRDGRLRTRTPPGPPRASLAEATTGSSLDGSTRSVTAHPDPAAPSRRRSPVDRMPGAAARTLLGENGAPGAAGCAPAVGVGAPAAPVAVGEGVGEAVEVGVAEPVGVGVGEE